MESSPMVNNRCRGEEKDFNSERTDRDSARHSAERRGKGKSNAGRAGEVVLECRGCQSVERFRGWSHCAALRRALPR